jgi:hypothetical protein
MRALKRSKAEEHNESLSLSSMNKTAWQHLSKACGGLRIMPVELPVGDETSSSSFPPFSWTEEPEGSQSSRFVSAQWSW